jgi:hypothetical protein
MGDPFLIRNVRHGARRRDNQRSATAHPRAMGSDRAAPHIGRISTTRVEIAGDRPRALREVQAAAANRGFEKIGGNVRVVMVGKVRLRVSRMQRHRLPLASRRATRALMLATVIFRERPSL